MPDVACFAAIAGSVPAPTMTSGLSRTNSAAISAKSSARPSPPTVLDHDGAALDPAEFAQPPNKGVDPCALAYRRGAAKVSKT